MSYLIRMLDNRCVHRLGLHIWLLGWQWLAALCSNLHSCRGRILPTVTAICCIVKTHLFDVYIEVIVKF
jgi:hypothetical protein